MKSKRTTNAYRDGWDAIFGNKQEPPKVEQPPKKLTVKDLVKDQKVHFDFYRQKELWYKTDSGFEFPVPTEDVGDGIFLRDDKAILFMRYIKKHLDNIEKGKEEQAIALTAGDQEPTEAIQAGIETCKNPPAQLDAGCHDVCQVAIGKRHGPCCDYSL